MKKWYPCVVAVAALSSTTALAGEWAQAGDWMVRGRMIDIVPQESSNISPATVGGKANFSNEVVPELDFTYFFTPNVAAELILATAKHHAKAENTSLGDVDVGSAWVLPPTLTLQYHFTGLESVKPYVGAGINYTMYYHAKAGALASKPDISNDFGLAWQAGVDVPLNDQWGLNLDVKKIYVDADTKWKGTGITADVNLDPWVIGAGVSYRF